MDALAYLERPRSHRLLVVHGDEDLLRRMVLQAIRQAVLGDDDDGLAYGVHAGESATFASVMDELQTIPFLGERRLVVVENADPFVTRYRTTLEKAVGELPPRGVLVLSVKTWAASTRLAKMVDAAATIKCDGPKPYLAPQWCVKWVATRHQKQLTTPAANLLVELVGAELGLLDQELLKLAIYVGENKKIDVDDVDKLVGRGRAENTWKIFDAIAAGQAKEALTILDRLLDQGEEPIRLLGAFSMQLRQAAKAYRLTTLGRPLPVALQEVGVPPFGISQRTQLLKHLGRRRAEQLYDWLLEIDQGVKGRVQLPERTQLERLVLRLAKKN
ncbi:MAG TPA: DNA polymerase III subunit delta [Gemmataceae bacterium]|nr:DNA polymerase III subunit delta [Gemmataceae bacterium]